MTSSQSRIVGFVLAGVAAIVAACGTAQAARPDDGPTTSSSATAPASIGGGPTAGTTEVTVNGGRQTVSFISGASVTDGNTANSTVMPALRKLLPNDCGVLQGWDAAVSCVEQRNDAQWYIDGANRLHDAGLTQFGWADVQKWAKARTPQGNLPEARVIQIFGQTEQEISQDQARYQVADLVGGWEIAKNLPVLYKPSGFMNTWRTKGDQPGMTDFADYNGRGNYSYLRVALNPLVLNEQGQVAGLLADAWSGIFVDCYNIFGKYQAMPATPTSPLLCPPGTSKAGQAMPAKLSDCNPGTPPRCKPNESGTWPNCYTNVPKCPPNQPYGTWPVCKDGPNMIPHDSFPSQVNGTRPPAEPTAAPPAQPPGGGNNGTPPAQPTATTTPRQSPPSTTQSGVPPSSSPAPSGDPCAGPNPDPNVC